MKNSTALPKAAKVNINYHCNKNEDALFKSATQRLGQSPNNAHTSKQVSTDFDNEHLPIIDGVHYLTLVKNISTLLVKIHQSGAVVSSQSIKKYGYTSAQISVALLGAASLAATELERCEKQKQKHYFSPKTGAKHYAH